LEIMTVSLDAERIAGQEVQLRPDVRSLVLQLLRAARGSGAVAAMELAVRIGAVA
jgi:hypothetical protein